MIRLRALGAIELRDSNGRELRELLVQPKRTALLAYLAVGRSGALHRRDTLLALFWPESDREHARGALSQALHYLRQVLPPAVLTMRGSEEVGLNPEHFWCDACAFDDELAAGRYEEALGYYRGHLLAGFHAATSSAFEDWLSAERSRLLEGATRAAWALAERDVQQRLASSACEWARRALALGPCNETDLRRFLTSLHQLGDRAGVIRTYEVFADHLRRQYDVDPAPETQELVAAIGRNAGDARVLRPTPTRVETPVTPALRTQRVDRFPDAQDSAAAPERGAPAEKPRTRYRAATLIGLAAITALLVALVTSPPAVPRVTGYTQLTNSRVLFPPAVSPFPLATDGSRIYFTEFVNLLFQPRQLAHTGGEAVPVAPLGQGRSVEVMGMAPDNSHLVVGEFLGGLRSLESPIWLWPVVGGPPRRMGELEGHSAGWSPDGETFVYMNANEIYLARADGTEPRKLLTAPGRPYWPAFSPDGRRLRFTVFDFAKTGLPTLWEASVDGTDLRRLLPGWNDPPNECCGSWTPDGKYYVFQATRRDGTHIWALRERGGLSASSRSQPVQLTTGPMNFIRPLIAPDRKKLFAVGWQLRGELAQYETQSGRFIAHPASLSAEWVAYARDGERMAFITYPEAQLWRSKSDGADRLQLTVPPMRARRPQWSPDGQTIAFEGQLGERPWKIYLVSADGAAPQALTTHDRIEAFPTWSPDGRYLAFSLGRDAGSLAPDLGIRIFDIQSREESQLDGSHAVREPSWSPDGRYIASRSHDRRRLLLFDFGTRRWKELARAGFVLSLYWSADGQFLHFHTMPPGIEFYRVRVHDGDVQRIGDLRDTRWVWGIALPWMGITPDGAPLFLRDQSIHHLYALDWER